jgi:hypothetical protein
MRWANTAVTPAIVVLGLLLGPQATAQPAASASAKSGAGTPAPSEAGKLFDEGLAEMLAGKYDSGCPKLEHSYELEPLPGAVFTLAECQAKWGKRKEAYGHYREYLQKYDSLPPDEQQQQAERRQVAAAQVTTLGAELSMLTLRAPEPAPPGAVVKRDGRALGAAELGVAEPLDPGEHTVSIEVPGAAPSEQKITLARGENRELRLVAPAQKQDEDTGSGAGQISPLATAGYITGGVGLAFLVVGLATGGATIAKKSTINSHCQGLRCDSEGKDASDSANSLGAASTATFVIGLAGVAAGAIMLIVDATSGSEEPAESTSRRWQPVMGFAPGAQGGGLLGVQGVW